MDQWQAGATVVVQEVWRGRLWAARPMTVVEADAERVVLWMPRGTRWKTAVDPPGTWRLPTRAERFSQRMRTLEWVMGDFVLDYSALWIVSTGASHAVLPGWDAGGEFMGWYLNLQEPAERVGTTLQTMDLTLDLIITPAGDWYWKDEDEVDLLVSDGILDPVRIEELRHEAVAVVGDFQSGRRPFGEGWQRWSPPLSWRTPTLPNGWDSIPAPG